MSSLSTAGKDVILLVDDNTSNLQVLRQALDSKGYRLLAARNGQSALAIARKALPDLILLDVMMPEMDGYQVCAKLKEDEKTASIPVIFITGMAAEEDEARGLALGAVDYITKPIRLELVKARVRNQLELKRYRDRLEELVRKRTRQLELTQAVLIEGLATLAECRDPETGGHIKRTQNYVKALAMKLKDHPRFHHALSDENIELLYLSAPLHDVGKVGVRDHILLKEGRLTEEEFAEMKKHTSIGRDTLRLIEQKLGQSSFLQCAREIAYSHQEKWDGSGYPLGLRGEEIPIAGRLMALADVYDALISKRVYKPPLTHEQAVEIIVKGRGSHFDPDVVDAFLELKDTFRNIALTYADYDEERQALRSRPQADLQGDRQIERLLLVEDNAINLEVMKSQLTALHYKVDTAEDGREALAKYYENDYDAILTDIDMPEMDGYELVEEIRRSAKDAARPIPILAITASDLDLTEERARAHGFSGYMLKPLDPDVLQQKLARRHL
ncbi:MAG: response regulator [Deltaproteobacteria bacterium]|nr:response regulator [Deltaproteobacteria bacterium]